MEYIFTPRTPPGATVARRAIPPVCAQREQAQFRGPKLKDACGNSRLASLPLALPLLPALNRCFSTTLDTSDDLRRPRQHRCPGIISAAQLVPVARAGLQRRLPRGVIPPRFLQSIRFETARISIIFVYVARYIRFYAKYCGPVCDMMHRYSTSTVR